MNWIRMRRISSKMVQYGLELTLKLTAIIGALSALYYQGAFMDKARGGIEGIAISFGGLIHFPEKFFHMKQMALDFINLPASDFTSQYESTAILNMLNYISGVFLYLEQVNLNLRAQPWISLSAALLVFGIFYLPYRSIRFYRQKGQGSIFNRWERSLGEKIFKLLQPAPVVPFKEAIGTAVKSAPDTVKEQAKPLQQQAKPTQEVNVDKAPTDKKGPAVQTKVASKAGVKPKPTDKSKPSNEPKKKDGPMRVVYHSGDF